MAASLALSRLFLLNIFSAVRPLLGAGRPAFDVFFTHFGLQSPGSGLHFRGSFHRKGFQSWLAIVCDILNLNPPLLALVPSHCVSFLSHFVFFSIIWCLSLSFCVLLILLFLTRRLDRGPSLLVPSRASFCAFIHVPTFVLESIRFRFRFCL